MKYLFCIIWVLSAFGTSNFAKAQEGVITYEVTNNLHRTVRKEQEVLKKTLPEIYITKHKLYFNSVASLYKMDMDEKEELLLNDGKRIQLPKYDIYIHPSSLTRILVSYFNERKYIIQSSTKTLPWKISEETKNILGYTCHKATYWNEEDKLSLTAWFTNKLRANLGPYTFYTLPGTVLEINVNNGENIYRATDIEIRKLKKKEIMAPVKGKKLTEEEYSKLLSQ